MQKTISLWKILIQSSFVYIWCTNLIETDSFYSLYLLCTAIGFICIFNNAKTSHCVLCNTTVALMVVSFLFSLSTIAANYILFQPYTVLLNILNLFLSLIGGWILAWNILLFTVTHFPICTQPEENQTSPSLWFLISFTVILIINLANLFLCKYPGVAPKDTISQIYQLAGLQPYSNWTPYWHTITIKFFYDIGFILFNDVNAAIATYSVAQVLFASACFAYVLVTLYQMKYPKAVLGAVFFLYAFLPYNIIFTITIGKDNLFGLGLLLMLTAFWRLVNKIGKSKALNLLFFTLGSLGFSLWRTNGWFVYVLFIIISLPFLWKNHRNILIISALVIFSSWSLLNPFLDKREIENGSITETMAVPFQQIARIIVNERTLTEEEFNMLSEIFDLEKTKELYTPMRVDPVKFYAFRSNKTDYFIDHIYDYGKLWLKLGIKYPTDYWEAWIDETKGFWHGGYDMGVYDKSFPENDLGIENMSENGLFAKIFLQYFRLFERPDYLQFFKSIGFVVWIIAVCFIVNLTKKRTAALSIIPVLIIILSLCIGTPVYAEFRYAYPVFIVSPLILFTTMVDVTPE